MTRCAPRRRWRRRRRRQQQQHRRPSSLEEAALCRETAGCSVLRRMAAASEGRRGRRAQCKAGSSAPWRLQRRIAWRRGCRSAQGLHGQPQAREHRRQPRGEPVCDGAHDGAAGHRQPRGREERGQPARGLEDHHQHVLVQESKERRAVLLFGAVLLLGAVLPLLRAKGVEEVLAQLVDLDAAEDAVLVRDLPARAGRYSLRKLSLRASLMLADASWLSSRRLQLRVVRAPHDLQLTVGEAMRHLLQAFTRPSSSSPSALVTDSVTARTARCSSPCRCSCPLPPPLPLPPLLLLLLLSAMARPTTFLSSTFALLKAGEAAGRCGGGGC